MKRTVSLKSITTKIGSGATPTGGEKMYKNSGTTLIRSQNILDFRFSKDGLAFIDEEQADGLENVTVKEGDILLNITGDSIARSCLVPTDILPARVNQHVAIIRANEDVDSHYLFYYLQNLKPYLLKICGVGGTRNALTKDVIEKLQVVLSNLSSQRNVSSILNVIQRKIELNNKLNDNLERLAKTIYDYWFVQFDFPDKNGRPYKSSGGKMVYSQLLKKKIPEGWVVRKISDVAATGSGGTPKSTVVEYYENGSIPWINSGELNRPFIISTENYITELGLRNSSAKMFENGSILMAMYGATAGKVSFLKMSAATNQAICAISPNSNEWRHYIKYCLEDMYQYLVNLSSGSARDNLSQDKIKNLFITGPDKQTLLSFDSSVSQYYQSYYVNSVQNQHLSTLRDWLLPMLMNGQVTVK